MMGKRWLYLVPAAKRLRSTDC